MKPQSSKLQQQQQEETVAAQRLEQKAAARGFATVEEMLRFDALQNPVPESVKMRLAESVKNEPKPRSWWRSLLP
jgi:ribosomal protein L39E